MRKHAIWSEYSEALSKESIGFIRPNVLKKMFAEDK